jgi:hypothetical protein
MAAAKEGVANEALGYQLLEKMGKVLARDKTRVKEVFRRIDTDGGGKNICPPPPELPSLHLSRLPPPLPSTHPSIHLCPGTHKARFRLTSGKRRYKRSKSNGHIFFQYIYNEPLCPSNANFLGMEASDVEINAMVKIVDKDQDGMVDLVELEDAMWATRRRIKGARHPFSSFSRPPPSQIQFYCLSEMNTVKKNTLANKKNSWMDVRSTQLGSPLTSSPHLTCRPSMSRSKGGSKGGTRETQCSSKLCRSHARLAEGYSGRLHYTVRLRHDMLTDLFHHHLPTFPSTDCRLYPLPPSSKKVQV